MHRTGTSRAKSAVLAGLTALGGIAAAAHCTGPKETHRNTTEKRNEALADRAAAALPGGVDDAQVLLASSGPLRGALAASARDAVQGGATVSVDAVCLGSGSVTVIASDSHSTTRRRVPCSDTPRQRPLPLTTRSGYVEVEVAPDHHASGGVAYVVRRLS